MSELDDYEDYYFPENDEGQILLDETFEDKPSGGQGYLLGLIAAGLLAISAGIAICIGWILYDRNTHSFMLTFAIMTTIAFLLGLFFAFIFLKNRKGGSSSLDVIVFVLGLVLVAYFGVTSVMMFLYQPHHYSIMNETLSNQAEWKDRWGENFDEEWKDDRNLMIGLSILSALIAFFSLLCVMVIYSNYPVQKSLDITLLYIALLLAFIFAIVAIREYLEIRWMEEHLGGKRALWTNLIFWLYVICIVLAVVTFLNAVFGLFKMRQLLLIFGFLLLLILAVGLVVTGLYIKNLKESSEYNQYYFGRDVLTRTHSTWAQESYCDSKYIGGQGCQKSDYQTQWDGNKGLQALNNQCFLKAARWYNFKYFRFLYFVLLCLIFVFMAIAANFFLTNDERYEDLNPIVYGVIGIMILFGLIMACFFIWGYGHNDTYHHDSFVDNKDSKFKPVPKSLEQDIYLQKNCADFRDMNLWTIKNDGYYRVALLGQGIQFGSIEGANVGAPESRQTFFQDQNSNNDYVLVHGTRNQVQNALNSMNVCIEGVANKNKFYIRAEKLGSSKDVGSNGLKPGEPVPQFNLTDNGTQYNKKLTYTNILDCANVCESSYDIKQPANEVAIKGSVIVKDSQNNLTYYGVPEADIVITAILQDGYNKVLSYTNQGDFALQTYAIPGMPYQMKLDFQDTAGYYLDNQVDITIPPRENIQTSYDVGDFQLLTRDGQGCKGAIQVKTCQSAAQQKKGQFLITAINSVTGLKENIEVDLRKTHSQDGPLLKTFEVNEANQKTGNLDYGPYMLVTKGKEFFQIQQQYSLQSQNHKILLNLVPIPEKGVHRFFMQTNQASIDYDLNLEFQNKRGDHCLVNPLNKYCGYATLVNDVAKGDKGVEILDVKKFVDANYMLFISPAPSYSGSCQAQKNYSSHHMMDIKSWGEFLTNSQGLSADDIKIQTFDSDQRIENENLNPNYIFPKLLPHKIDIEPMVINNNGKQFLPNLVKSILFFFREAPTHKNAYLQQIKGEEEDKNLILNISQKYDQDSASKLEQFYKKKNKNFQKKTEKIGKKRFEIPELQYLINLSKSGHYHPKEKKSGDIFDVFDEEYQPVEEQEEEEEEQEQEEEEQEQEQEQEQEPEEDNEDDLEREREQREKELEEEELDLENAEKEIPKPKPKPQPKPVEKCLNLKNKFKGVKYNIEKNQDINNQQQSTLQLLITSMKRQNQNTDFLENYFNFSSEQRVAYLQTLKEQKQNDNNEYDLGLINKLLKLDNLLIMRAKYEKKEGFPYQNAGESVSKNSIRWNLAQQLRDKLIPREEGVDEFLANYERYPQAERLQFLLSLQSDKHDPNLAKELKRLIILETPKQKPKPIVKPKPKPKPLPPIVRVIQKPAPVVVKPKKNDDDCVNTQKEVESFKNELNDNDCQEGDCEKEKLKIKKQLDDLNKNDETQIFENEAEKSVDIITKKINDGQAKIEVKAPEPKKPIAKPIAKPKPKPKPIVKPQQPKIQKEYPILEENAVEYRYDPDNNENPYTGEEPIQPVLVQQPAQQTNTKDQEVQDKAKEQSQKEDKTSQEQKSVTKESQSEDKEQKSDSKESQSESGEKKIVQQGNDSNEQIQNEGILGTLISQNSQDKSEDGEDYPTLQQPELVETNVQKQQEEEKEEVKEEQNEGEIMIFDRRLQSSSSVFSGQANNYIIVECFTGYGKRSFVHLKKVMSTRPALSQCVNVLKNSRYNLENLLKEY